MFKDVINCIPSKTMKEYLMLNPLELSILQEATIVYAYAENKLPLFQRLIDKTNIEGEKLLLSAAVSDIEKYGYINKATKRIYKEKFECEGAPYYPFLEICKLPVLFSVGEIIRKYNDFYYVADLPELNSNCDFSDECYLCYSLSCLIKDSEDLFVAHDHIHVCVADRASIDDLNEQQKCTLQTIKKLADTINYE